MRIFFLKQIPFRILLRKRHFLLILIVVTIVSFAGLQSLVPELLAENGKHQDQKLVTAAPTVTEKTVDIPEDTPEDTLKDIRKNTPENTLKDTPEDIPKDTPKNTPENTLKYTLNDTLGLEHQRNRSNFTQQVAPNLQWFSSNDSIPSFVYQPAYDPPRLWAYEAPDSDRILDQLQYAPAPAAPGNASRLKTILVWKGLEKWTEAGQQFLLDEGCKVNTCQLSEDRTAWKEADAIFFRHSLPQIKEIPPKPQTWVVYVLESPAHMFGSGTKVLNTVENVNTSVLFAHYHHQADIVTPYARFLPYDVSVRTKPQGRNYAWGKDKLVAWFVSHCRAPSGRDEYVRELQQYVPVDVYGKCGPLRCKYRTEACYQMLSREYKFYVAFENSQCRDYISEKLLLNGLQSDIVPVVLGAHPDDYARAAPHRSYIHADWFDGPRELAQYLLQLDRDDEQYNQYFQWKGTGEFINTKFYCRLCAMLHAPPPKLSLTQRFGGDFGRWYMDVANGSGCLHQPQHWGRQTNN